MAQLHESDGCNGLKFIFNTGEDLDLTPLRITKKSMPLGALQKIHLESRRRVQFLNRPLQTRNERNQLYDLPRHRYNYQTVAIAPPLVLQERRAVQVADWRPGAGAEDSGYCFEVQPPVFWFMFPRPLPPPESGHCLFFSSGRTRRFPGWPF